MGREGLSGCFRATNKGLLDRLQWVKSGPSSEMNKCVYIAASNVIADIRASKSRAITQWQLPADTWRSQSAEFQINSFYLTAAKWNKRTSAAVQIGASMPIRGRGDHIRPYISASARGHTWNQVCYVRVIDFGEFPFGSISACNGFLTHSPWKASIPQLTDICISKGRIQTQSLLLFPEVYRPQSMQIRSANLM